MKSVLLILIVCLCGIYSISFSQSKDTSLNKKRFIPISIGIGSAWTGGIIGLSTIWYDDFEKSKFHTFDDGADWMQMDKAGHVYTAFHLSEANYRLFRWSGLSENTSKWLGAGIGFGFQTSLELLDGKNSEWGFSWYDMAANALGTTWFFAQQSLWKEQRLLLKFSYQNTRFAAYRPTVLGSTFSERLLKDYNGQTYWLSFSPRQFTENWHLPAWICFSLGYSVEEKLIGDKNIYIANDQNFQARRQYLLSLDIDVRELPIKKEWIKAILRPFHYIKIPFPTLMLDGTKFTGSWLYF